MAGNYIRAANAIIAVKEETTPGVDAWGGANPDPATDFMRTADIRAEPQSETINLNENTGSLDVTPGIAGAFTMQLTFNSLMRGSGDPKTPPVFGRILKVCSWGEEILAAAVGAPTAASAGTDTSVNLPAAFSADDQKYRGYPLLLSGNPAAGAKTFIIDYAGASKTASLLHKFNPLLDTSSLVQIPACVIYRPVSDDINSRKSVSVRIYIDGLIWKMTGVAGNFRTVVPTRDVGRFEFTLQGQYAGVMLGSIPQNLNLLGANPPVFRNGISRINRELARISSFTFDSGVQLVNPENPEALEGSDPAVIIRRQSTVSFDPLARDTETIARIEAFKNGVEASMGIGWGTTAGNRFGIVMPRIVYNGITYPERNGLLSESIQAGVAGQNAGAIIACY